MFHDLKWSPSEKKIARKAFDTALQSALGKVMTEFMNEDVIRERIVGCNCAVKIENAAATICPVVCQDLDKLIRSELSGST